MVSESGWMIIYPLIASIVVVAFYFGLFKKKLKKRGDTNGEDIHRPEE